MPIKNVSSPTGIKVLNATETEYQKFFKKKMADYGVDSPAGLDEEDKKKFWNEIELEWTGEKG